MRFLIDECLTVELAREAERAGFEAHHVAHLGKASSNDWAIRDYAIKKDFVLVTNNAGDFRALYAARDLHPGLVILVPNAVQETQVFFFARRCGCLPNQATRSTSSFRWILLGTRLRSGSTTFPVKHSCCRPSRTAPARGISRRYTPHT